jgi:hypothetical protein
MWNSIIFATMSAPAPPTGQSRAKYGAPFCMHITFVRSSDL